MKIYIYWARKQHKIQRTCRDLRYNFWSCRSRSNSKNVFKCSRQKKKCSETERKVANAHNMKDFNQMFASSRYSAVCPNDEEAGGRQNYGASTGATSASSCAVSLPEPDPAAAVAAANSASALAALQRAQRRKSLKANRQTMKMDILSSFFSERDPSKRSARSPTCKLKKNWKKKLNKLLLKWIKFIIKLRNEKSE